MKQAVWQKHPVDPVIHLYSCYQNLWYRKHERGQRNKDCINNGKEKGTWWLVQQLPSNTYGSISDSIYFPPHQWRKIGSGLPCGQVLVPRKRRQTTAGSIHMLWASVTQVNNESNAEQLHLDRKGREEINCRKTCQHGGFRWDGRQLTRLSLTYRCCSARRGVAGEIAVHHLEYNQPSTWLGR